MLYRIAKAALWIVCRLFFAGGGGGIGEYPGRTDRPCVPITAHFGILL